MHPAVDVLHLDGDNPGWAYQNLVNLAARILVSSEQRPVVAQDAVQRGGDPVFAFLARAPYAFGVADGRAARAAGHIDFVSDEERRRRQRERRERYREDEPVGPREIGRPARHSPQDEEERSPQDDEQDCQKRRAPADGRPARGALRFVIRHSGLVIPAPLGREIANVLANVVGQEYLFHALPPNPRLSRAIPIRESFSGISVLLAERKRDGG